MPALSPSPVACRVRTHRARRRAGRACYMVEIDDELLGTLVDSGALTDGGTTRPKMVGKALTVVVLEWGRRYREAKAKSK